MKASDLRKSILQYAVEGKLVPQNENDEVAEVLYKKIQKEKEELIKQGKIKKDKPLPPVNTCDEPYNIPNNWKWVRLGEVIELLSGQDLTLSNINDNKNGIPYITGASSIQNNKILINRWTMKPTVISKKNDILITCKGTIGKLSINNIGNIHIARQIMNIKSILLNKSYVFLFLLSSQTIFNKQARSIVPGITRTEILYILFPLPPLAEQERIVKKVDELMALCEKLEQEEEKLKDLDKKFIETLPKSILQYAIEGKLVPQDENDEVAEILYKKIQKEKEELIKQGKIKKDKPLPPVNTCDEPYTIPDNWKWVRLGEVCSLSIGKTPERKITEYWKNGIYNWVSISDMINGGFINKTKEKISITAFNKVFKKDLLPVGSLLFSFKLTIGKVSILNIPAYTNEAICAITPYKYDNIKQYLFKVLPILNLLDNANDAIKGKTLNLQTLPLILIPLPPLAEQERIVKKVDELMALCKKLEQEEKN